MNEFEDIEKELQALQPKPPTDAFTARVADALGDSGDVSFRRISPELHKPRKKSKKLLFFLPPALALAASLAWMFFILPSHSFWSSPVPDEEKVEIQPDGPPLASIEEDEASPLHGVSLEELEAHSGVPTNGWLDPQVQERLIHQVDEGLIRRPGFAPGRQVRYHYLDETLWMHPTSNTRIISTTPRQEVLIMELDLY